MFCSQAGGFARDAGVDGNDFDPQLLQKPIQHVCGAHSEVTDQNLGVDAARNQPMDARLERIFKAFDRHTVLRVTGVEKCDEDICAENYRGHSSRSEAR
jgi:hypothetical protein